MLTRWQGVPADADLASMIREVRLTTINELPEGIPTTHLTGRRRQIATRAQAFAQRTSEGGWTDAT